MLQAWAAFAWIVGTLHLENRVTIQGQEVVDKDAHISSPETRRAARAERALEERVAGFQGFAALFCELCSLTGLQCVIIEGKLRGLDGFGKSRRHYWNAVRLGPRWALVDCFV